jgi:cyclase
VQFRNHRDVGDILELAGRYCASGADELVFYDITASPDGRSVDRRWVSEVAAILDIPFCVAGGIRSIESAEDVLHKGADKISVNTPALQDPDLIDALARRFGSQCVVVGVDSLACDGRYEVQQDTGDESKSVSARRETSDWIREAQNRGAGEFVLNCINQDGVRSGYDCKQLQEIRELCSVPLIASGGAGCPEHFLDVFSLAGVDGALAASVFHTGELSVAELKHFLLAAGIDVRPTLRHAE